MRDIPWGALRSLTAREIISALIRDGFSLHNQRGSHQRYRHADGRRVTLTYHRPGDTFPMGTLRSMIEIQARWTEADLRRLSLLAETPAVMTAEYAGYEEAWNEP